MTNHETELERAMDYAMAEFERIGDADKLPKAVKTVLIVHTAQGIIDSGGFEYFFGADFPNQPPYTVFVEAYREIGATKEADVIDDVVKMFPFPEPHKERERRCKFMSGFFEGANPRSVNPFNPLTDPLCGNEEIWRRLEDYVVANAAAFPK